MLYRSWSIAASAPRLQRVRLVLDDGSTEGSAYWFNFTGDLFAAKKLRASKNRSAAIRTGCHDNDWYRARGHRHDAAGGVPYSAE